MAHIRAPPFQGAYACHCTILYNGERYNVAAPKGEGHGCPESQTDRIVGMNTAKQWPEGWRAWMPGIQLHTTRIATLKGSSKQMCLIN